MGNKKQTPEVPGTGRYIEVVDGKPYITTATHGADGKPLPEATAENFRRLAPRAAEQLRAQGTARRPASAAIGDEAQAAATAERERVRQILQLPRAKGREALAQQLALTPNMSVEHAAELLAVAPIEQPYSDGVLASEPNDEARAAADHAVRAARDGGFIR